MKECDNIILKPGSWVPQFLIDLESLDDGLGWPRNGKGMAKVIIRNKNIVSNELYSNCLAIIIVEI